MNQRLKILAMAIVAMGIAGCTNTVVKERVVVREQPQRVVVKQIPAPIQETRTFQPGPGHAWIPGHWVWQRDSWAWQSGYWYRGSARSMPTVIVEKITVAPSPSHYWVPGHWRWRDGDWIWINGHWKM